MISNIPPVRSATRFNGASAAQGPRKASAQGEPSQTFVYIPAPVYPAQTQKSGLQLKQRVKNMGREILDHLIPKFKVNNITFDIAFGGIVGTIIGLGPLLMHTAVPLMIATMAGVNLAARALRGLFSEPERYELQKRAIHL